MDSTAQERVTEHLAIAIDAIIAARVLAGGLPGDIRADDALDTALGAEPSVKDARKGVQEALQAFQTQEGHQDAFLALEEATNALAARCAEVGYKVGRLTRT